MLRLRQTAAEEIVPTAPAEPPPAVAIVRDFEDPYLEPLRLLREAAEIEYALMVEYLYAAFTVRPEYGEKLQGATSASARNLMGVAIQEMKHLGAVNRLLVALGATPCMERQDFPTAGHLSVPVSPRAADRGIPREIHLDRGLRGRPRARPRLDAR